MRIAPNLSINDYANNMFRFDRLNARWISACAGYLKSMFGNRLERSVVIDYAFGRGNWAVAFAQAGARRVVAVDASFDNCQRLGDWVASRRIDNVEVVHGNILEGDIPVTADIVWAHGIIPVIADPVGLLSRLREKATNDNSLFHLYTYDRFSMRQWVVELARRFSYYNDEATFRADAPLFSHTARMRARDDLTAPVVWWHSAAELAELAKGAGLSVVERNPDFSAWTHGGIADEEFQPHNLLCINRPGETVLAALQEPPRQHSGDLSILVDLADPLFDPDCVSADVGRKRAIGLCNTHFDALAAGGMTAALLQDFLYLMYLHLAECENPDLSGLSGPSSEVYALALAALNDESRPPIHDPIVANGILVKYLCANSIRL